MVLDEVVKMDDVGSESALWLGVRGPLRSHQIVPLGMFSPTIITLETCSGAGRELRHTAEDSWPFVLR